jgi:diguanylate cyclase (GGDEF)-like protein
MPTSNAPARTDPLTGLGNRRSLEQALPLLAEQLLGGRARHRAPRRLALIVVDIDEFKQVNDLYGHAARRSCARKAWPN